MTGLLDRYVLRRFVAMYGLCLAGFLTLFLVVNFFSKLDDFLDSAKDLARHGRALPGVILEYYATQAPLVLTLVGPYLTLFAAIAAVVTFSRHNELAPMVMAGRNVHRVLAPVYAFAALAVVALVAAEEFVVPWASRRHDRVERMFEGRARPTPHLRDGRNVLHAAAWLPLEQILGEVRSPSFRDPGRKLPEGALEAVELRWRRHPTTGVVGWYPRGGRLVPNAPDAQGRLAPPINLPPDRPLGFGLRPTEIDLVTTRDRPGLPRAELQELRKLHPRQHALSMLLYTRTTRPVSSLVLLLLGLPFVLQPGRRSIAAGLGVALGACAAYVGVDFFFQELGNRGDLQPLVAAWFAPVFFAALSLARLDRVPT